jgi:hypothetical protein
MSMYDASPHTSRFYLVVQSLRVLVASGLGVVACFEQRLERVVLSDPVRLT